MALLDNMTTANMRKVAFVLLIAFLGISTSSYAAVDTTLFRIKSLQDTVDAGDTIDVDIFIGDDDHLAGSIKEFELEIEYDLDICDKNAIQFTLDNTSLSSFFGTAFTDISNINTMTGNVNIQVNCNSVGSGTARIGRIRYIVQDNVNGRQLLKFDFFKLSAKRTRSGGNDNPVKMQNDSVLVIKDFRQIPTAIRNNTFADRIKIYPNPTTNYLQIEGDDVQQYQILAMDGSTIVISNNDNHSDKILVSIKDLSAGTYVLQVKVRNQWKSYQIQKE